MKNTLTPRQADVGIIVGRFQVHELHEAHRALIDTVCKNHQNVMVFIGLSPLRNTLNNPLDFTARKALFAETYPDIEVHYIEDTRSDQVWSKRLDAEIEKWINPHQSVMLYGSRDSFINHYFGKYPTCELESEIFISGKEIRKRVSNKYKPTKEFRAGLISATFNRWPTVYTTVDVAIIDSDNNRILLGKKQDEDQYRLIGGFASPDSDSFEEDARREVMEETGVEIGNLRYIGSAKITDWRYRNEIDKVKTLLFIGSYMFGRPQANDDIAFVGWFSLDDLKDDDLVEEHRPLLKMVYENLYINS